MWAPCGSVAYYKLVGQRRLRSQIGKQTPRTFIGAGRSLFDRRERLRGRFNVCSADRGEA